MQLESALEDPHLAHELLAGQTAAEVSEHRFRDLVRLESARRGFREVFMGLVDGERVPALIHCSTGKDRTGWAVAAFLSLLRVPPEHVMSDYLRSGEFLEPTVKPARDAFVQLDGDPGIFDALAGVRRENLTAAFDEMERSYGSIDSYFEEGLGIDAAGREALRSAFVEPATGSSQGGKEWREANEPRMFARVGDGSSLPLRALAKDVALEHQLAGLDGPGDGPLHGWPGLAGAGHRARR